MELLLEKGASPASPNSYGLTPLMVASFKGHAGVVDRLLHHPQATATLDHRDREGSTALLLACHKSHGGVVRWLLEAGADPTIADYYGRSPMAIARQEGKEECVMLLEVRGEQEIMMVVIMVMVVMTCDIEMTVVMALWC